MSDYRTELFINGEVSILRDVDSMRDGYARLMHIG